MGHEEPPHPLAEEARAERVERPCAALGLPVLLGGHQGQLAVGPVHGGLAGPAGRPWRGPSAPHALAANQQWLVASRPRANPGVHSAQRRPRRAGQGEGGQRASRGAACDRGRAAPEERGVGSSGRLHAGHPHQRWRRRALGRPGGEERVPEEPGTGALEVAMPSRPPV